MIYSDDFVWLHFPRCAGTKIEQLFKKYYAHDGHIFQDIVDPSVDQDVYWHDSIAEREARNQFFSLGDRAVICSFRRLPSWLESRYSFEFHRSPQLNHQPEQLLEGKFLEQSGSLSRADWYVTKYLPQGILYSANIRFIRPEYLEHDFNLAFGEFLNVSVIPDWEFRKKVNVSVSTLPGKIKMKLYESHDVYKNCPYWKKVEDVVYGSIHRQGKYI